MNPRVEVSPVMLTSEWEDPRVHRAWTTEDYNWSEGIIILVCYGRTIGKLDWAWTDAPITCIRCLGMSIYDSGLEGTIEPLHGLHTKPGFSLDPNYRFK